MERVTSCSAFASVGVNADVIPRLQFSLEMSASRTGSRYHTGAFG